MKCYESITQFKIFLELKKNTVNYIKIPYFKKFKNCFVKYKKNNSINFIKLTCTNLNI